MFYSRSSLICACALATALMSPAGAQVATPPMLGHWKGEAQIAVNWTKRRTLDVDIVIDREDRVVGTIGDAKLLDARLTSNRGWLTRRLGWKTDYIITGKLQGAVIEPEGIVRTDVTLPLDWKDNHFEGGVNTSGSQFGGAESMILAAGRLILHRVPDMVVCQATVPRC